MMRKALLSSLSEVMNLRSESLWKKALYGLEDVDLLLLLVPLAL
jgi:hypothetical protein